MRISDWSSDVCSSDLIVEQAPAGRGLEALVRSYLSIGHRDRAELGCAASALAPEIARESLPARESFMRRTREMTELIASTLPVDWAADIRTERGYAIFASMMGSLQLMRTASDRKSTRLNSSH